jgi:hypothetical protein
LPVREFNHGEAFTDVVGFAEALQRFLDLINRVVDDHQIDVLVIRDLAVEKGVADGSADGENLILENIDKKIFLGKHDCQSFTGHGAKILSDRR